MFLDLNPFIYLFIRPKLMDTGEGMYQLLENAEVSSFLLACFMNEPTFSLPENLEEI